MCKIDTDQFQKILVEGTSINNIHKLKKIKKWFENLHGTSKEKVINLTQIFHYD